MVSVTGEFHLEFTGDVLSLRPLSLLGVTGTSTSYTLSASTVFPYQVWKRTSGKSNFTYFVPLPFILTCRLKHLCEFQSRLIGYMRAPLRVMEDGFRGTCFPLYLPLPHPSRLRITSPNPDHRVLTDILLCLIPCLSKLLRRAASRGSGNRTGKPRLLPALSRPALPSLPCKWRVTSSSAPVLSAPQRWFFSWNVPWRREGLRDLRRRDLCHVLPVATAAAAAAASP